MCDSNGDHTFTRIKSECFHSSIFLYEFGQSARLFVVLCNNIYVRLFRIFYHAIFHPSKSHQKWCGLHARSTIGSTKASSFRFWNSINTVIHLGIGIGPLYVYIMEPWSLWSIIFVTGNTINFMIRVEIFVIS